ncbi:DNA/RNA non-specific endonuclease [Kiloniella majae]|uniref:DNA/RNA non-specific endonuclease n=1 Tax=Kiloniella majae TaxID=1938558 RepID=UPI000A278387|nr:DNA/RNA non-specific endonuclease [Kiloniella majae]
MRTLLTLTILLSSTSVSALEIHSDHWLYGIPEGLSESNDLIIRRPYALSNNDDTKFADWVAYQLTPREVWTEPDLVRKWRPDPFLDADERLEPGKKAKDDYHKASKVEGFKFDRGHLAPLASFKGSVYASDVNYYSNITPQAAALNQGPWRILEEKVRTYVLKGNAVWVQTGPLYEIEMAPLPGADETHKVPSGFWKIIQTKDGKSASFIMEQTAERSAPVPSFAVSIDEIEQRSGLDINPLSDADETVVNNEWFWE